MPRPVFSNVDDLLQPDALSTILGVEITDTASAAVDTEGFSDNALIRILCTGEDRSEQRLMLKRFDGGDWIARLTDDRGNREVSLFETGWYERLPDGCKAPMLAAVRGEVSALLMEDVSDELFPPGDDLIDSSQLEACLSGAAALHAADWGSVPAATDLFCTPEAWLGLLTPEVGRTREALGVDNDVTASLEAGWQVFIEALPAAAAGAVGAAQRDPSRLLAALDHSPRTLIHGDLKLANLGVGGTGDLVLLDWALAAFWSPFVEIGWFLAVNSARLPIPKEAVLEGYRTFLAGSGIEFGSDWERHVDLGLLAGGVLRLGWAKALGATSDSEKVRIRESAEIEWWGEAAERAARWLA